MNVNVHNLTCIGVGPNLILDYLYVKLFFRSFLSLRGSFLGDEKEGLRKRSLAVLQSCSQEI